MENEKAKYDVCIIGGLGHVGLPLGISLAAAGKRVALYDINKTAIETVSKGEMPFIEHGAEALLKKTLDKTLFLSSDPSAISQSRYVIVVIGTPVDEHLNPKFTIFRKFLDDISGRLRDGQHIVLRSTIFPGTTGMIREYFEAKGLKVSLSFCPERIAQGKAIEELKALPQIISAFDEASMCEAAGLFSAITDEIIRLNPLEAELAKLFTNVWRYIQFAISNQFYQIAASNGLDFQRIHEAITYKYPRAAAFPRAGLTAGPCLFKDTMQLAAFSNNNFFLGHAAMLINEGLPNFIVQNFKQTSSLKDKTTGVLGMAFKAESDDKRESLSYKLRKILEMEAKKVLCSDVYIREEGFVTAEELVEASDVIFVGAPHKEYASLDLKGKTVVDIWNIFGKTRETAS